MGAEPPAEVLPMDTISDSLASPMAAAASDMHEAPASKTLASQAAKGTQSYYYWHSSVPQGEGAAPKPTPQRLATSTATLEQPPATLENYAFADDGDFVKIYIDLEGPLAGLTASDVEAEYGERTLRVTLRPPGGAREHQLLVAELQSSVRPQGCKHRVTKSGKLVVTLDKANSHTRWNKLRR